MTGPDILFVTRKWAPAVGGMETWSHQLSAELAKLSPVEVIALPGQANGHPPGAAALLAFPWTVLRRYLARKSAPDVLHLGDMAIWPLGLLAGLRKGKTSVVLTAHGTDVSYPRRGGFKGAAYGAYLRLGARLLGGAMVTANSPATAAAARDCGWSNTRVIPLGTDIAGHNATVSPGRHVLFAGRLIAQKGCSWFINEVLPLLDDDICLHVAGTRIEPAEAAAFDHPRVRYLGTLAGSQLTDAYRTALAVVVPNIVRPSGEFEGFGLVAIEAAAAGGVVLAADCGGLPAAVADGESGFLVRSGDAAAWQTAIARVASWDLPERQSFISGALAGIDQHYRWPRVAAETLAAYADRAE